MTHSLGNKEIALIAWLKDNNIDITHSLDESEDTRGTFEAVEGKAMAIASMMLGANLLGSGFEGIENLLTEENEAITYLRNCSVEQMINVLSSSRDNELQTIGREINGNKVLENYNERKKDNELHSNQNSISEAEQYQENDFNSQGYNREQQHTYERNGDQRGFTQQHRSNVGNRYNGQQSRSAYHVMDDNFADNKDLVSSCGNSLDIYMNGARVVVIPQEDGTYSLKMETTIDNGKSKQWVNEQIISREEFQAFVERYEEQIFGLEKQYESSMEYNSYGNESLNIDDDRILSKFDY